MLTTNKINLDELAKLTDANLHTEAFVYIASCFSYLEKEFKILNHIKAIHEIENHLPYNLNKYRTDIYNKMINQIYKNDPSILKEIKKRT